MEHTLLTNMTVIIGEDHTDEYNLRVTGTFTKGSKPTRYGDYPDPGDPDEFDISSVKACRTKFDKVLKSYVETGPWVEVPNEILSLEALEHLTHLGISDAKDSIEDARCEARSYYKEPYAPHY